jgi:hypothetical protein
VTLGRITGLREHGIDCQLQAVAGDYAARNLDNLSEIFIGSLAIYSWSARTFRRTFQVHIVSARVGGCLVVEVPARGGEPTYLLIDEADREAAMRAFRERDASLPIADA